MEILYILSKYTNKQTIYKKNKKQTIMKKIAFMLFASATIFLASCTTGAEKTETTTTDSTAVVESQHATSLDSCATLAVDTTSTSVAK